ncbi:19202_t:CDS:1, partial [Racocetra fulgida]
IENTKSTNKMYIKQFVKGNVDAIYDIIRKKFFLANAPNSDISDLIYQV